MKNLLTYQNAKTTKGEQYGYLTAILYLAPHKNVDGINTCKYASKGCAAACLYTAGRGKFSNVKAARVRKTELLRDNKTEFFNLLVQDIQRGVKKAAKKGLKFAVRLNGTSDIVWENFKLNDSLNIFELFPDVQFYDYTKDFTRLQALTGQWQNYHLTFSWNESAVNNRHALRFIDMGINVAIVFDTLPAEFRGREVINGDESDLRFLDKKGVVVGLKAKGDAIRDTSGFVIRVKTQKAAA